MSAAPARAQAEGPRGADLGALRAEFPIFAAAAAAGEPFHYLDSASTGQICRPAADALLAYETTARANVRRGVYRLADAATEAFETARARVARYIGAADPSGVAFTSGTTLALNIAAHALTADLGPGDEILVSELEHHANLVPWQLAAGRRGLAVRAIPVTDDGRLDLDRLPEVLTPRTRIVAVAHASNVTGAVTDVARLREAARAVGARLVLDGAQAAAHGPVDVAALGCDAYALSGHKMFGATGAGALWLSPDLGAELPPLLGGGEMIAEVRIEGSTFAPPPRRFEAGTPPIGAAIAMGAAADFLLGLDWEAVRAREAGLASRAMAGLDALPGIRLLGPAGLQGRLPILAFEAEGAHAHDLCQLLGDAHGVMLRGGHHCAQPLMDRFDVPASARASLALYSGADDVDAFLEGLDATLARLR